MEPKARFDKLIEEFKNDVEYETEGVLIDITEQIVKCMEARAISRAALADRLGCTKAYVSKLLSGEENLTTKKIVQVAMALNCQIDIAIIPHDHSLCRTFTYTGKRAIALEIQDPFTPDPHNETAQSIAA